MYLPPGHTQQLGHILWSSGSASPICGACMMLLAIRRCHERRFALAASALFCDKPCQDASISKRIALARGLCHAKVDLLIADCHHRGCRFVARRRRRRQLEAAKSESLFGQWPCTHKQRRRAAADERLEDAESLVAIAGATEEAHDSPVKSADNLEPNEQRYAEPGLEDSRRAQSVG